MGCEALNVFGLVENYGYGQLYGVRLAKLKTNRVMLCSQCQDGYGLERGQWEQAMQVSKEIKARTGELSLKQMAQLAVRLAHKVFPDIADEVREVLAEQLGEAPLVDADSTNAVDEAVVVAALEGGGSSDLKTCPDCAETVKAAARKCRFCGYRRGWGQSRRADVATAVRWLIRRTAKLVATETRRRITTSCR